MVFRVLKRKKRQSDAYKVKKANPFPIEIGNGFANQPSIFTFYSG